MNVVAMVDELRGVSKDVAGTPALNWTASGSVLLPFFYFIKVLSNTLNNKTICQTAWICKQVRHAGGSDVLSSIN